MKIQIHRLQLFLRKNEQTVIFSLLGCLVIVLFVLNFQKAETKPSDMDSKSASVPLDTLVPDGTQLVPIELANGEALSALIEDFAIVDLYETGPGGLKPGRKVGHRLRMVRAPANPEKFAVLVPEGRAAELFQSQHALFGVLLSRALAEPGQVQARPTKTSRIQYVQ